MDIKNIKKEFPIFKQKINTSVFRSWHRILRSRNEK